MNLTNSGCIIFAACFFFIIVGFIDIYRNHKKDVKKIKQLRRNKKATVNNGFLEGEIVTIIDYSEYYQKYLVELDGGLQKYIHVDSLEPLEAK